MTKSFGEYADMIEQGESRTRPGVGVSYVLDGDYYAEWALSGIEVDYSGEVTPAGWAEVERQNGEHLPEAYAAYLRGESYTA